MREQRSIRHHYIPKGLQKYFCFTGKKIWYSERDTDGKYATPEERNIDSTFQIKDYYTIRKDGKLSDDVERKFYGPLDDFLAKLLDSVHSRSVENAPPTFDLEKEFLIARALIICVTRNPDFSTITDDQQTGLEVTNQIIEALTEIGEAPEVIEDDEISKQKKLIEMTYIGREIRVHAQLQSSQNLESELKTLTVRWARSEGTHSFVLCSALIYLIGSGGPNGLSNPNFEMWLPISPKIAMVLTRDPAYRLPMVFKIDRDHMRKINEYGMDKSRCLASHDLKLLQSLISNRYKA